MGGGGLSCVVVTFHRVILYFPDCLVVGLVRRFGVWFVGCTCKTLITACDLLVANGCFLI